CIAIDANVFAAKALHPVHELLVGSQLSGERRVREAPQEGVKRTLRAERRARRRRQPARTRGPRPLARSEVATGQGGGPCARDGTSPPNLPFGCAAPARDQRATHNTAARRCSVSRSGRLGGPTGHARSTGRVARVERAAARTRATCRTGSRRRGRCPHAVSHSSSRALQRPCRRRGWEGQLGGGG